MNMRLLQLVTFLTVITNILPVHGFSDYLLKKCSQSGFCNRNRFYAEQIKVTKNKYYSIDRSSIEYFQDDENSQYIFKANIVKRIPRPDIDDILIYLPFTISFFDSISSFRFTIDEVRSTKIATQFPDQIKTHRYNETWKWAFDKEANLNTSPLTYTESKWISSNIITIYNKGKTLKVELNVVSFSMKVYYDNKLSIAINDDQLMNIEHLRTKQENFQNILPEESSFNMFGDNFEYCKDDTLKFGPESVGLDFGFIGYNNIYGIPEHAESLKLRDTRDSDPYRLFNVDVFEYNVDSVMPTYGAIPLLIAASPTSSVGLFWINAADTWVDINYHKDKTSTHWISENGIIDVILFFEKSASAVTKDFITLTGKPQLPLLSSIGYHQCRWNYNDEADVLKVDSEMDKSHIPYDFIWLDLEYTDDRQYFTWKPTSFSTPRRMLKKLENLGRQLVVLIDPHIKTGYEITEKILQNNVAINNSKDEAYVGRCWPGKSIWIDTINPLGRKVWDSFIINFVDNIKNLHIWNDMNEPSIFDGPETTAPKDVIHGGWEHRSVHNIYGLSLHEATYNSLKKQKSDRNERPFLLTRSFYAGSQRTAAVWTGDNVANWDYLRISIPMVLTNNIVGYPFIGADVAGFSGDPEPELIARWYQAAIWYPFFRGHAHIDSKRREPYLFEEPLKSTIRNFIKLRYTLLPTIYTAFYTAHTSGTPIMKPMFFEKPDHPELYNVDDQFYVGDSGILVKPVVAPGVITVEMKFTPGIYYEYQNLSPVVVEGKSIKDITIDTPLEKSAIFIEGGHILTRKDRYRRSSLLMKHDPYTLLIAPDLNGRAHNSLYVDDGITFEYEEGQYILSHLTFSDGKLINKVIHTPDNLNYHGSTKVSKIIIANGNNKIQKKDNGRFISKLGEYTVPLLFRENSIEIVIDSQLISINEDWELIL